MPAPKRTKFEREKDLLAISEMYLQGKNQYQIADQFGVTQATISHDLKELRKRWLNSSLVNIDERRAEELVKIDALEKVYWESWDRSCNYEVINKKGVIVLVPKDKRDPLGNKRYLEGVQWCIDRRIKILGLDAPDKIELYDWRSEARQAGYEPSELEKQFMEMANATTITKST